MNCAQDTSRSDVAVGPFISSLFPGFDPRRFVPHPPGTRDK